MYVCFDTSQPEEIALAYRLDGKWEREVFPARHSGALLESVATLLHKFSKKPADICGLFVVVGKGKFTATRVAVTVGNTLAYAYRIPIIALDSSALETLECGWQKLPAARGYAAATYSAEAHIGKHQQK